MSKVIAIITAGGSGLRMRTETRKQYIEIGKKPILAHTVNNFQVTDKVDEIVLAVPAEDIEFVKKSIVEKYNFSKVKHIIKGGEQRQESVFNALSEIRASDEDIILIHDGVRPFISHDIINECIISTGNADGSIVGIKPVNTIKIISGSVIESTLDRNSLISVQTPQTFRYGFILKCYELALKDGFNATDDSALAEKYGENILGRKPKIIAVDGRSFNIKITDPNDLIIAEALLDYLSV
ncbi:MAG TPA: 2-C-methyl-D-erythritol 4-phosphate cytidylyltransferase [Clostridiales bacterium]|mgnify:CR=1 FL=1|nr:2-C-methyl-D-erythritol 4-phosphate cytidylyltransferase [Clostridiales bacterium]HQP70111.1 2-C-methyl-D-erythritol 4-phosphate cytidylyltransferase [Clostridiales bacterium]